MAFINYYQVLGLNSSAAPEEIRRAYRILARRYHPDVNPGHASEEKFKLIAEAYHVLNDAGKRRKFDSEFESQTFDRFSRASAAYRRQQSESARASAREHYYRARARDFERFEAASRTEEHQRQQASGTPAHGGFAKIWVQQGRAFASKGWKALLRVMRLAETATEPRKQVTKKISILEISVTMRDTILGVRKTVEIPEEEGPRKVSVKIPPGMRSGSVLRLARPGDSDEELVFVIRVASHPFLSIHPRGLMVEIPVSPSEALVGASITVPTLEDPVVLKVPPGSQSGTELRLKERGITLNDGSRGDLFYRLLVMVPTCYQAVGIEQKCAELDKYFEVPIRQSFPKTLLQDAA